MKKIICVLLVLFTLFNLSAMTCSCVSEYRRHVDDPDRFKENEWEYTRTYFYNGTTIGRLVYGFDTTFIDEDYAWTMGTSSATTAALWRYGYDEGYSYSEVASSGTFAKEELKHEVYNVYYKIIFSNTYNDNNVSAQTTTEEKLRNY